jgi:hypothetical protein
MSTRYFLDVEKGNSLRNAVSIRSEYLVGAGLKLGYFPCVRPCQSRGSPERSTANTRPCPQLSQVVVLSRRPVPRSRFHCGIRRTKSNLPIRGAPCLLPVGSDLSSPEALCATAV